jgi:hypothetical protein
MLRRKVVGGAVGLAVLAGAGGAYAVAQGGGDEREEFKNDVAKRLNVTPDELDKAVQGAAEERLDEAVREGRLTQKQADEIKKRMREGGGPPFLGGPPPGDHFHGGGPGAGHDAAADYLGLSEQQLHSRLRDGKTLADVAKAEGKSVDGLKDAMKAAIRKELEEAVADKRLTEAQKDEMLERLDEHIDEIVENGPRMHRGPGPGFHHGPPVR